MTNSCLSNKLIGRQIHLKRQKSPDQTELQSKVNKKKQVTRPKQNKEAKIKMSKSQTYKK